MLAEMLFYLICFAAGCKRYGWKTTAIIATAGAALGVGMAHFTLNIHPDRWGEIYAMIALSAYLSSFLCWGIGRGCAALFSSLRSRASAQQSGQ